MLQNLTELAACTIVIYCFNLQGLRSPDDFLQSSKRPVRGGLQNMTLEENNNLPIILTYYYKGSPQNLLNKCGCIQSYLINLPFTLYDKSNIPSSNTETTLQGPIHLACCISFQASAFVH